MILFAMLVGGFTSVQFILDFWYERSSEYLVIVNGITFSIASIGLWIFGFKNSSLDLSMYSVAHIYAYVALIIFTLGFYILSVILKGKNKI